MAAHRFKRSGALTTVRDQRVMRSDRQRAYRPNLPDPVHGPSGPCPASPARDLFWPSIPVCSPRRATCKERARRPAVGRWAGGTGRGRTLPRPSDLTAVASAWRRQPTGGRTCRRALIRSAFAAVCRRSRLRQVMLPALELPVWRGGRSPARAAARHRMASSPYPPENFGGPWKERENGRSERTAGPALSRRWRT